MGGARVLNELMSFGHVVRSDGAGTVIEAGEVAGPEILMVDIDKNGQADDPDLTWDWSEWTLLRGFTGQYGYHGPIMHESEFIGGGLERHIRENAGYYVAVIVDGYPPDDNAESVPVGWAVAFKDARHEWRQSTFGTNTVCGRCGLLPLDQDDIESECEGNQGER